MKNCQPSLFPPPEPPPMAGSPVLDFELALKDGGKVSVHYERRYFLDSDQFEFEGDSVSSSGYFSHFTRELRIPDDEVIEAAAIIAERLREERLDEIAKENRRGKRRAKSKVNERA